MAVAPTGNIFKALSFDNVSSRTYGVYITGEAVYNAPEREVEMISIPGRNGSFALDKGRFENIEVTYPAGVYADNELDFARAISDFRNFLCSKRGYCRLTDDYNPDEYRMAVYKSGLEVSPAQLKAGEFEITFDCKPQRYLMSGESEIEVTSGNTILNPTLFGAKPMLEVEGYGTININDDAVIVEDLPLGEVKLSEAKEVPGTSTYLDLDVSNLNTGDLIYSNTSGLPRIDSKFTINSSTNSFSISSKSGCNATVVKNTTKTYTLSISPTDVQFEKSAPDAPSSIINSSVEVNIQVGTTPYTMTASVMIAYFGSRMIMSIVWDFIPSSISIGTTLYFPAFYGYSTITVLPSPMYIDLDVGEAYGIVDGTMLSFNNTVQLPAVLPELNAGANTITYDDTVTDLKIVPRWWKI